MPHSYFNSTNGSLPFLDNDECIFYQSCQPFVGTLGSPGPLSVFDLQDPSAVLTEANNSSLTSIGSLNCISNSSSLRDLSDESNNQSAIYGCPNVDVGSGVSTVIDPSVSSTILVEFSTLKNADFHNPSDCLVGNLSSSQDLQSQFTSASLGDSQAFSRKDLADNSGLQLVCTVEVFRLDGAFRKLKLGQLMWLLVYFSFCALSGFDVLLISRHSWNICA
ncbi:auxin response factor 5 isoform X1 [Prunus yedoensis var. nudiflora]|uniref:Auxin response factor 5 isoform X1 n=1 Tax=Prunus yedoensis var. nudiflora TaxID=2094558 RepID=A0A314ZTC0_PRUYE|nr:auxin response factor 5 isoform X1 [Prunus yedoensis var. nudiflora]